MSWNKPKQKLSKAYEWVWDHVEPIKSVLLTFLILFSIFLTWKLWTYTPKLEKLDDTNPIVASIEKGMKIPLEDVIEPSKVLLHHNSKHYWIPNLTNQAGNVYEQLQNNVLLVSDNGSLANSVDTFTEQLEIIYPTPVPMPVLKNIFQFSKEHPFSADLGAVTSINVYKKNNDWYVRFVPEHSKKSAKAHYDFQVTEAQSLSKALDEFISNTNIVEVEKYTLDGTNFYLPKDQVEVQRYWYPINEVDMDDYLNFLLPGDIVKVDSLENRVTYSDGKSIIQYFKNQDRFAFTSPSTRSTMDKTVSQPGIIQGVDFINNHTGWTDVFHLYDYSSIDQDYEGTNEHEEMQFRMVLNGIPVMDNSIASIKLEYTNNELYRYDRSLLYLPKHSLEDRTVKLKSGADVIDQLEQLSSRKVKDIMIGYHVINNKDEYSIRFEPEWYYKVGSTWLPVKDIQPPLENEGG